MAIAQFRGGVKQSGHFIALKRSESDGLLAREPFAFDKTLQSHLLHLV
jgi:hypothetical protein